MYDVHGVTQIMEFAGDDFDTPIDVEVWDWDLGSSDDLIGALLHRSYEMHAHYSTFKGAALDTRTQQYCIVLTGCPTSPFPSFRPPNSTPRSTRLSNR